MGGEPLQEQMSLDGTSAFVAAPMRVLPVTDGAPCGTLHFRDLLAGEVTREGHACDPLLWLTGLFVALLFRCHTVGRCSTRFFPPRAPSISRRSLSILPRAPVAGGALSAMPWCWAWERGLRHPAWGRVSPAGRDDAAIGQTFPPVAVLAIAVPVIRFGQQPAIIALILYGVLPVLRGRWRALRSPGIGTERREGMGMSSGQRLCKLSCRLRHR